MIQTKSEMVAEKVINSFFGIYLLDGYDIARVPVCVQMHFLQRNALVDSLLRNSFA